MKYNFDKIYDRRGTGALKTDILKEKYGRDDLISLWIADMDFATPDCILDALKKRMEHPIFGYSGAPDSYWKSLIDWEKRRHDWDITRNEITFIPGIVRGIAFVLQCFTKPGDRVLVQPPVYYPFMNVPLGNDRKLLFNPLKYVNGQYEMDFVQLENIIKLEQPKVLILSNPHNPGGRVWSPEELKRLAGICSAANVLVISDEIHADMPLNGYKHTPFLKSCADAEKIGIAFCAPSKTFNMAGIVSSFCVVKNPAIRETFYHFLSANELDSTMVLSTVATEAAFKNGEEWQKQCMDYIQENISFVSDYISVNIPQISVVKPQASFLLWLNCRMLNLDHDKLIDLFVNKAHIALNDGEDFGPGGEGFMRMNVGCPRKVLKQALVQLKDAVAGLYEH